MALGRPVNEYSDGLSDAGERDRLVGKLQEKYGYEKQRADMRKNMGLNPVLG